MCIVINQVKCGKLVKYMKRNILIILLLAASVAYAAGPFFNRGQNQYMNKNYDRARELFLQGLKAGERGNTYFFLGEIERLQGNLPEAQNYYALALTVNTTQRYVNNAYMNFILIAEQRGDTQALARTSKIMWQRNKDNSAKDRIEQLINRLVWTDNRAAIEKYNQALRLRSTEPAKSIELFAEAVKLAGDFIAAQFEQAMLLSANEKPKEAKRLFEDITTKIPIHASAHIALANILYDEEEYEASIEHYNKALEFGFLSRDTEFLIFSQLSKAHFATDRPTEALNAAAQASRIRPSDIPTLLFQSSIYIRQRDLENAMRILQSAEKIDGQNPDVLLQIGSIYFRNKDPKHIQYFDRLAGVIISNPRINCRQYSQALNILLRSHFDSENYARIGSIAPRMENCLSNESILITARAFYHLENYSESIKYFERLKLNNDQDIILLCCAYVKNENKAKAESILRNATENSSLINSAQKNDVLKPIINEIRAKRSTP